MIKLAIIVFIGLEFLSSILLQTIQLWFAAVIYPQDYKRESVRKIGFRRIPTGPIEPAEGKETVVNERNRKIGNLRKIFLIINAVVAVLIYIFK